MGIKTHVANALAGAGSKVRYDTEVKKVLSDKTILAWIMKFSMEEFKEYSIWEIRECIESEPEIGEINVRPGHTPEAIIGNLTEDQIPDEGKITYDIRFYAVTPDKARMKIIINIEAQKKYHVSYDLVTRGVFYCARMLSSQLDTEFTTENYDEIKKVYSIWICMDAPEYAQNTITEYHMTQDKLYGNFNGKARYDLLSVVMICLGKGQEAENDLLNMLNILLSEELPVRQKENLLTSQYGIETIVERKGGLGDMCNLSDLIEERGIEKGKLIQMITLICFKLDKGKPIRQIAEELDTTEDAIKDIVEAAQTFAPEYDVDGIYELIREKMNDPKFVKLF